MSDNLESVAYRRKQRRKRIRRRRLLITAFVLFICAILVFVALAFTVLLPVKNVIANGSKIYSEQELVKASKITEKNNILTLSKDKIEENMQTSLPYVDEVKLSRKFPDTVELKITDAKEDTCFKTDDGYFIVSKSKRILKKVKKPKKGLTLIISSLNQPEISKEITYNDDESKEIISLLMSKAKEKNLTLNRINIKEKFSLKLRVNGRFDVLLGNSANLDKKIDHLASMIENIGKKRTGEINLSMWTKNNSEGSFKEGKLK